MPLIGGNLVPTIMIAERVAAFMQGPDSLNSSLLSFGGGACGRQQSHAAELFGCHGGHAVALGTRPSSLPEGGGASSAPSGSAARLAADAGLRRLVNSACPSLSAILAPLVAASPARWPHEPTPRFARRVVVALATDEARARAGWAISAGMTRARQPGLDGRTMTRWWHRPAFIWERRSSATARPHGW
jgi:hypothetical protein